MTAPALTSRFQAIIAAKPTNGAGPPVITSRPTDASNSYEPWGVRFESNKKRRRSSNAEAGPSVVKKVVKRGLEDEGTSSREPTKVYQSRDDLLKHLRDQFRNGPDVGFHGTYETMEVGLTHKQGIQMVAHEIWKTTGYRFTVKDHPQFINGHKTRFWCSQDDAHRSKSSRAARKIQGNYYKPRVTSAGEIMAKARYPCRSRLLISSRDSNIHGMRSITIRMHHHVAHEPYVDSNLPPEVIQRLWEGFGWIEPQDTTMAQASETPGEIHERPSISDSGMEEEESSDGDRAGHSLQNGYEIMHDDVQHESPPQYIAANPTAMPPPPPVNLEYRARMQAHIKNLREFSNGLEYQLQFDDYRMLEVLEREGGSFLELVRDCLQKEGRLEPTGDPIMPHPDRDHHVNVAITPTHPTRNFEGNPGINPRALDY